MVNVIKFLIKFGLFKVAYTTKDGYFYNYKIPFAETDENSIEELGQFDCGEGFIKGFDYISR